MSYVFLKSLKEYKMPAKIIWSLLILLISFASCGKDKVSRQAPIEKIDIGFQKEDEEAKNKIKEYKLQAERSTCLQRIGRCV
jgi:hypothetical protein